MRSPSVGDGSSVRVRALNLDVNLICRGSGAGDLATQISRAWDWCVPYGDDPEPRSSDAVEAADLTLLLEYDPESLAVNASGYDLFAPDLDTLMDRLSPRITRLAVGHQAGRLLMLHACAVADPETGRTAILFGPSGTGKTTLSRALGSRFAYLTDETAAVDPQMRMVPYPKPLSIIASPGDLLKQQVSAGELGLVRDYRAPAKVAAVIQLDRQPERADGIGVERLHIVDALPEMVAQASYTASFPRPLHRLAEMVHYVGAVHRVSYREAGDLGPVVADLLTAGAA